MMIQVETVETDTKITSQLDHEQLVSLLALQKIAKHEYILSFVHLLIFFYEVVGVAMFVFYFRSLQEL